MSEEQLEREAVQGPTRRGLISDARLAASSEADSKIF